MSVKPLKIVFAGTPEISATILSALIKSEHKIVAVLTQPDRKAGRGKKLKASEVKVLAEHNNIQVLQPVSFRKNIETLDILKELNPDIMVVVAYGLILPEIVLNMPKYGCLNIHVSLLPKWRGAAPIQRAVLAGDKLTGVSIMQMDKGLDTGDILNVETCDIAAKDTTATLHDKLAKLSCPLILKTLKQVQNNTLLPIKQTKNPSYAHKLTKEEAPINWFKSAGEIDCQIRAFNPWPVATTKINEEIIKIWEVEVIDKATGSLPGTILSIDKKGITLATSEGCLNLTKIQFPGKKALDINAILNGRDLSYLVGTSL